MDHKYKALLQNIPTRHVITAIAKPADRPQQIAKLRNLDINNFFILGSLQSIRDVLGVLQLNILWLFFQTRALKRKWKWPKLIYAESAKDEYFQRNFAWHAITQYNGDLSCNCKNATIIYLKPVPDQSTKDRLGLMVKRTSLHYFSHILIDCFIFKENHIQFEEGTRNHVCFLLRLGSQNIPSCKVSIVCFTLH